MQSRRWRSRAETIRGRTTSCRRPLVRVRSRRPTSWFDFPDAFAVITNRAVRRELAPSRGVRDRHPSPRLRLAPERAYAFLLFDVGLIISKQQIAAEVAV